MTCIFRHPQLLPQDTSLELDEPSQRISLWQAGERVTVCQFTEEEWRLLPLFFRGTAIHCTYAEALSALSGEPLATCQACLKAAKATDQWEETGKYTLLATMKPVNHVLEECQERFHRLGLHICGLLNYGYVLTVYEQEVA